MKHGVHEPYRFNERVNDKGVWTYDAITYISFEGDEATISGFSSPIKPSYMRELRQYLFDNGVRRFMYYSKGEKVIHVYNGKGWVIQ